MVFSVLIWKLGRKFIDKKVWKILNVIGTISAVAVILKFTVWGREETVRHIFMLAAPRSSEFYREMLMNVFLYFPLGLTLTNMIGFRSILFGSILSVMIETWQFMAGTGVAQGTDVLCNVLGIVVGSIAMYRMDSCYLTLR